jgi:hypothetical protein
MSSLISDFFQADHLRLDALLERAAHDPAGIDGELYAAFRAGLLRHIALEEKLLMPAARRRRGGEPLTLARRLRVEHGAIALLLVPSPTHELIGELRSWLEPHNCIEEAPDGLYAECDALLVGEAKALLEQARAYPAVKAARYNDGPRACRSAREALRISEQQR